MTNWTAKKSSLHKTSFILENAGHPLKQFDTYLAVGLASFKNLHTFQ